MLKIVSYCRNCQLIFIKQKGLVFKDTTDSHTICRIKGI